MPFLAPVAAGATFGSLVAQLLVSTAISYGASYLVNKLSHQDQRVTVQGGAILNVQYGEKTPRVVAIGDCCVAGKAVYDNTFGNANKQLQRVVALSDFYTSGLTSLSLDGEYVTLGTYGPTYGYPVTTSKWSGHVYIKYYDGFQTTADGYLVGQANPSTRWGSAYKGIGISYAILTFIYHEEDMNSLPSFEIRFKGAPLYDFRKDTSVGGSGSHRFNDPSTWEYSANPVLADYTFRRGFEVNNDLFCGMGMPASDLPLSRYIAAANVCDEDVDGDPRYAVSIFLDASDKQHGDNIEDIMLSCAGQVIDSVEGSYPLVGAAQVPVGILNDSYLVDGAEVTFQKYRSFGQLVNSVSGTYTEPDLIFGETGYSEQTLSTAVVADRRTLDFNLNLPMVTVRAQAERLASIYFNENRFEVTKSCTVTGQWQTLELGDWITWEGDRDGLDRDYQIVAMTISTLDNGERTVFLQLQERHDDIYDGAVLTSFGAPVKSNDPILLNELSNLVYSPTYIEDDDGTQYPVVGGSWDEIDDVTVAGIFFQWRLKTDNTKIWTKYVRSTESSTYFQEGILGLKIYEFRHRLYTFPGRTTLWSDWEEVITTDPPSWKLKRLSQEVRRLMRESREEQDRLNRISAVAMAESMNVAGEAALVSQAAIKKTARANAAIAQEVLLRVSEDEALASLITALEATVDDNTARVIAEEIARASADSALASSVTAVTAIANAGTASGLFKLEAVSAPAGVTARLKMYVRASTGGAYTEAGLFIDVVGGGTGRIVLVADQHVFATASGTIFAVIDSDGFLVPGRFKANSVDANFLQANSIEASKIVTGTLTADKIAANNLSIPRSSSTAGSAGIGGGATATRDNIAYTFGGVFVTGGISGTVTIVSVGTANTISIRVEAQYYNGSSWVTVASQEYARSIGTSGSTNFDYALAYSKIPTAGARQFRAGITFLAGTATVSVSATEHVNNEVRK